MQYMEYTHYYKGRYKMNNKNLFRILLCLILCISSTTITFATSNTSLQPQMQTAYTKSYADIPSGRTATGFYYGLERLASVKEKIHEKPVTINSVTKLGNNQYQVVCTSENLASNGTFIVDIFNTIDDDVRDGYSMWFGLFDANISRYGTAQVKRK